MNVINKIGEIAPDSFAAAVVDSDGIIRLICPDCEADLLVLRINENNTVEVVEHHDATMTRH